MDEDFGLWDVLLSVFWLMLLFAWISLLINIFGDLFRDRSLSGWAKAGWAVLLIFLPWLGALLYLVARGGSMHERAQRDAEVQHENLRAYIKDAAGTPSTADELRKLAEMRDSGMITPQEYEGAKAKVLS